MLCFLLSFMINTGVDIFSYNSYQPINFDNYNA
jgi:hypothetical protein